MTEQDKNELLWCVLLHGMRFNFVAVADPEMTASQSHGKDFKKKLCM